MAELALLLKTAPEEMRDLIVFGVLTGLRPQELRLLRHDHIYLDMSRRRSIRLEVHKTSKSARNPKPRSIPLSAEAEAIIDRQRKRWPDSEVVFLNADGGAYDADVLRRRLHRWCSRAEIRKFCPYALRHTFASLESDAGVNAINLAALLGHGSVRTTQRYVSASDEFKLKAVDMVAAQLQSVMPTNAKSADSVSKSGHQVATNGVAVPEAAVG